MAKPSLDGCQDNIMKGLSLFNQEDKKRWLLVGDAACLAWEEMQLFYIILCGLYVDLIIICQSVTRVNIRMDTLW